MSRPRKPSAVLELSGAFRHDPQRRRPSEPKESRPLGESPGRLPADCIAFWNELVEMSTYGVLKISDRWAVELCCRLMEKATREMSTATILELSRCADLSADDVKVLIRRETISSGELSTLRSLLAALGMTPADRTKLSVSPEKPKNEFADLAEEARGNAPSFTN